MAGGTVEFTAASVEARREEIKRRALQLAIESKVVTSEAEAVVRDLLATDLGASEPHWTQTLNTDGAYNQIYNVDLDDKKIVVIYGAIVPEGTNASALKFSLGTSKVIDIWDIDKAKYTEDHMVIADEPIVYNKSATINIEAFLPSGVTTPATDNIVLLGVVVEPKGKTISPDTY